MCSVTLLTALLAASVGAEHLYLEPLSSNESLPEKALLLMPGGAVENTFYLETARAVQEAATSLRLWVIVPDATFNLCILSCPSTSFCWPLKRTLNNALRNAEDAGWNRGEDSENLWIAGHSLGGVCAGQLLKAYDNGDDHPFAGMILWASEVYGYSFDEITVPFMVQNAELDGLSTRPSGTAPMWREHLHSAQSLGYDRAIRERLVVILPGLNHSDWCPGFDVKKDLRAEVSQTEALEQIGETTAAFLQMHTLEVPDPVRDDAFALLEERRSWTSSLLSPYLQALDMERNASTGGSAFSEELQRSLSGTGAEEANAFEVEDAGLQTFRQYQSCMPERVNSTLVKTCSFVAVPGDALVTKIVVIAEGATCADGNRLAEQLARELATNATLQRYVARGRRWCVSTEPDLGGGVQRDVETFETFTCLNIRSPGTLLSDDLLSCRLLTPAKALDWMMTDSLREVSPTFVGATAQRSVGWIALCFGALAAAALAA